MWKLYQKNMQLQLRSLMEYRASFFFQIVGILVGYLSTIIIFWMIFQRFPTMGGWSFHEIMLVYSFAITSINVADVFFSHFKSVEEELVDGTFQRHLLRPYSAFFSYMTSKFNVAEFSNLFISLAIFVWVYVQNHVPLTLVNLLVFLIGMFGAICVNAALLILIGSVAFWTLRSENLYWSVLWPAQYLSYMPISIFPKFIQAVFTYVIPLVLIGFYPSSVLLGRANGGNPLMAAGTGALIGLGALCVALLVWSIGIRKFEGTGS